MLVEIRLKDLKGYAVDARKEVYDFFERFQGGFSQQEIHVENERTIRIKFYYQAPVEGLQAFFMKLCETVYKNEENYKIAQSRI